MSNESELQQLILLEAPKIGVHLMRNNSGACQDSTGRWIWYGLGVVSKKQNEKIKSLDLIGFKKLSNDIAQFAAVECKKPGWVFNPKDKREVAQKAFIDFINNNGGRAGFCSSVESFRNLMSF